MFIRFCELSHPSPSALWPFDMTKLQESTVRGHKSKTPQRPFQIETHAMQVCCNPPFFLLKPVTIGTAQNGGGGEDIKT